MTDENEISFNTKILEKLKEKKNESDRFIKKYQTRRMFDLEEYYKSTSWTFDFIYNLSKKT